MKDSINPSILNHHPTSGKASELGASGFQNGLPKAAVKWLLVPAVTAFVMVGKTMDDLARAFGLERARDRLFLIKGPAKDEPNSYLKKKYRVLYKNARNGRRNAFRRHARALECFSIAYRVAALHRVEPRWYEVLSLRELKTFWKRLDRIARTDSYRYEYKRVYIPKADGSLRPLAVPPLHWRVWASMKYTTACIWLEAQDPEYWKWQHGGRPGNGVNTAWRALWPRLRTSRHIYEYDLSKFFDRIHHRWIGKALDHFKFPEGIKKWCLKAIAHTKANRMSLRDWRDTIVTKTGESAELIEKMTPTREVAANLNRALKRGVPQGFNLSPLLSCMAKGLAIKEIGFPWDRRILSYMDDGLIMSPSAKTKPSLQKLEKAFKELGSEINKNKSKWIKTNNRWEVDRFRFLGVEYLTNIGWVKAKTRGGAEAFFPAANLDKVEIKGAYGETFVNYLLKHGEVQTSMKYGIFEAILAKLWTPESLETDENGGKVLIAKNPLSFWSYYVQRGDKTTASSESGAALYSAGRALLKSPPEHPLSWENVNRFKGELGYASMINDIAKEQDAEAMLLFTEIVRKDNEERAKALWGLTLLWERISLTRRIDRALVETSRKLFDMVCR